MNKIWCFGDSFTFGHGCRIDCPRNEYYNNYWKEGDDIEFVLDDDGRWFMKRVNK